MPTIKQEDFISSVADALQFISYYHPEDFIRAMAEAYEREQSESAKDAIAQILVNSRMSAEGHRPLCQDTGTAIIMGKKGQQVWTDFCEEEALSKGVFNAYLKNNLRYSQNSPFTMFEEKNTGCNLPAQIDLYSTPGDAYSFLFVANYSKFFS